MRLRAFSKYEEEKEKEEEEEQEKEQEEEEEKVIAHTLVDFAASAGWLGGGGEK